MFIPERQREALMRLTMCARDECMMCIYQPKDDRCKDIATTAMHILANALKVDDADTPQTERIKTPDYCDICNHKGCDNCTANNLDEYCVPSGYAPKDTPQTDCGWK